MRILQICSKPPLPAVDGGCKATNAITQALIFHNVKLDVISIATSKHPFLKNKINNDYLKSTQFKAVFVDTKIKIFAAFKNLFSNKCFVLKRFFSHQFQNLILEQLQKNKYDFIILEGLNLAYYLPAIKKHTSTKIIYRAHNVEHEIWYRKTENESKFLKRIYLNYISKNLKKEEINIINQVNAVISITERDKNHLQKLGCKAPISVIPFGLDISQYQPLNLIDNYNVGYIGSLDWKPNLDAILWFINKVWKNVSSQNEKLVLNVAGKSTPNELKKLANKNINILGEVDDAIDFINQNKIIIVPLFSGSGMRVKIVEAMALGKIVVASSIAAEGINFKDKDNILIASNENEFTSSILNSFNNEIDTKCLESNAQKLVYENFDNKKIADELLNFIKNL